MVKISAALSFRKAIIPEAGDRTRALTGVTYPSRVISGLKARSVRSVSTAHKRSWWQLEEGVLQLLYGSVGNRFEGI